MPDELPAGTPESSGPVATATPVDGAAPAATQGTPAQPAATADGTNGTPPQPQMLTIMGRQIEASKVPPEFAESLKAWNKDYTEKSQAAAALRRKAEALDSLTAHDGFKRWYAEQLNPQPRREEPQTPTPEQQAELLSDPVKFDQYVEKRVMDIVQKVALPAAQQAQMEARTLRNEQEIGRLAGKYSDFDDLTNSGKLEEVMLRYAKKGTEIDLEDAYWLAKRPFMESEAIAKAQGRVQEKVGAQVLPPTNGNSAGVKVIPAKGMSLEDKLRAAFAAGVRGEKVQFDPTR